MKICSLCYKNKPLNEFQKRQDTKEGYRKDCKTCRTSSFKLWYEKNSQQVKLSAKNWAKQNSHRRTQINNKYAAKRRKSDQVFAIASRLRNRIGQSIRLTGYKKNSPTEKIIGISYKKLLEYLWTKFEIAYKVERSNEMLAKIHIDHVIPVSSAKTEEEVLKLNHYTNLQFLLAEDNLSKGARIL